MSNPIVINAMPSIILMLKIKKISAHYEIAQLRQQFINEIKIFNHSLTKEIETEHALNAAQYCLCAMIDETILNTSWGKQSVWAQQSLVNFFYHDTWGGERFYLLLQQCLQQPRQHISLLEFLYLLLSLGFQGQYFAQDQTQRDELRRQVFARIRSIIGKASGTLSNRWCDNSSIIQAQQRQHTLRLLFIISTVCISGLVLLLNIKAFIQTQPLWQPLQQIAQISPISVFSQLRK